MKLGFQLALMMLSINVAAMMWSGFQIAGYQNTNALQHTGSASDYASKFDPDAMLKNNTDLNVVSSIAFLGNIYTGLTTLWNTISFLVYGFPTMLNQFGSMIQDPTAHAAFDNFVLGLYGIESFIYILWIYQLLTGRDVSD